MPPAQGHAGVSAVRRLTQTTHPASESATPAVTSSGT